MPHDGGRTLRQQLVESNAKSAGVLVMDGFFVSGVLEVRHNVIQHLPWESRQTENRRRLGHRAACRPWQVRTRWREGRHVTVSHPPRGCQHHICRLRREFAARSPCRDSHLDSLSCSRALRQPPAQPSRPPSAPSRSQTPHRAP